jgi:hypothetical protein
MNQLFRVLFVSIGLLLAGQATAQMAPIQLKKPPVVANPAVLQAPLKLVLPADPEALVQSEIKRLQKKRDDISAALAKVGANYSKLTYTPATGNSCVDPDTTFNPRSGESFACVGMTTCIGRMSRWSKNRFNPCEPGVTIDSCVTSDECKGGSVCDTGAQRCVRTR